ncbi:hypothetical protein SDC9_162969 [bioreactor metagenome]|uniref:Uncharacterized protein n=1 Tax=bioreactor metagenome TaxID=1076179 RepID=A0A645FMJ8_9ZZZZ
MWSLLENRSEKAFGYIHYKIIYNQANFFEHKYEVSCQASSQRSRVSLPRFFAAYICLLFFSAVLFLFKLSGISIRLTDLLICFVRKFGFSVVRVKPVLLLLDIGELSITKAADVFLL